MRESPFYTRTPPIHMASSSSPLLPPILFVDANPAFEQEIWRNLHTAEERERLTVTTGKITKDYPKEEGTCFISPANSIGFMDGGVDAALMQLLPGVEFENTKRNGELQCYTNADGTSYLPIGSASVLRCDGCFLISAPTMWVPQDVSKTNNVYWAMRATFSAAFLWNVHRKDKIKALVCPGMATGYGKMSFRESVTQILRAYREFDPSQITERQTTLFLRHDCYLDEPNPEEQPRERDNILWHRKFARSKESSLDQAEKRK